MDKTWTWPTEAGKARAAPRWRSGIATLLRAASRGLDHCAHRLTVAPSEERDEPVREFHACAGDTDGSLYLDGKRVGTLPGVTRL